ncbi:uncharacterized protein N7458_009022 [Penicillium daleae]|uniref:Bacteriophage T5 Orf172 DNA-binding domain-containing protein n=1 Tax=Penicillium daleae TaxID=63821 RepID=A0AAD6BYZ1_9EURO|nr:uncharacterized protein N7458_009022 [Penicillium daleae]KAJ5438024.1 hypothetical protein N7458_009022 [Penicillium daleae]
MESPITTFFSLVELVDWDHGIPAAIQCAYMIADRRRCRWQIAKGNLILAQEDFASHHEMISGPSGECTRASPQFEILKNLANIYICRRHNEHKSQAIEQWLKELDVRANFASLKLEEGESFQSSHIHPAESEEHTDAINAPDGEHYRAGRKPGEEEHPFGAAEGVSVVSNEPPPVRIIRRANTMEPDAVAQDVTWLLKQPLDGPLNLEPGYIYVICPPGLPGIFKIGYTLQHPELGRLNKHDECYGEVELIAKEFTEYVHRVEQLLLAEFSNNHYQLEGRCHNCDHSHRELLKVDKKTLLRSLKKWVKFIESPAYDRSGLLLTEAQSRIPRPASKKFLRCERPKRSSPGGPNSAKKGEGQKFQTTSPRRLDFEAPTPTKQYPEVGEAEINPDEICPDFDNLHLTPSKPPSSWSNR